jgi:hypothetical protein
VQQAFFPLEQSCPLKGGASTPTYTDLDDLQLGLGGIALGQANQLGCHFGAVTGITIVVGVSHQSVAEKEAKGVMHATYANDLAAI